MLFPEVVVIFGVFLQKFQFPVVSPRNGNGKLQGVEFRLTHVIFGVMHTPSFCYTKNGIQPLSAAYNAVQTIIYKPMEAKNEPDDLCKAI